MDDTTHIVCLRELCAIRTAKILTFGVEFDKNKAEMNLS